VQNGGSRSWNSVLAATLRDWEAGGGGIGCRVVNGGDDGPGSVVGRGQRWRCRSLRFLIRLPQVAMSHQAPARLWERS
jgi:hypothetical protein